MHVPIFLVLVSSAAVAATVLVPDLSDLILVAGPAWLASLWVLGRDWRSGRRRRHPPQGHEAGGSAARPVVIVDGSNVLYWNGGEPLLDPLREVVAQLKRAGYRPGVVLDANAGHVLEGRYRHDGHFAQALGLPRDRVMVVDKGVQADEVILQAARDYRARIVSNDRFRDRAARFPDLNRSDVLVRGGYRAGRLWLDLKPEADARGAAEPQPA